MTNPYKIKQSVGPDYNHDQDDVFRTKTALKDLGHFKTPDYGLTKYPDTPLFDGIKSYQRAKGLRVDGVMKPDGPTAAAMGKDLGAHDTRPRARGFVAEQKDTLPDRFIYAPKRNRQRPPIFDTSGDVGWGRKNDPRDVLAARRGLAWAGHLPEAKARDQKPADNEVFQAIEAFQRQAGVKKDGWMGRSGETAKALNDAIAPKVEAYLKSVAGSGSVAEADGSETDDLTDAAGDPLPARPGAEPGNKPDKHGTENDVAIVPAALIPFLLTNAGRFGLQHLLRKGGAQLLQKGSAAAAGAAAASALKSVQEDDDQADAAGTEPQVAMAPKPRTGAERGPEGAFMNNPWIGGGSLAILGTAAGVDELRSQRAQRLQGGGEVAAPPPIDGRRQRTEIATPPPSNPPPLEMDDDRFPDKEEFPAEAPAEAARLFSDHKEFMVIFDANWKAKTRRYRPRVPEYNVLNVPYPMARFRGGQIETINAPELDRPIRVCRDASLDGQCVAGNKDEERVLDKVLRVHRKHVSKDALVYDLKTGALVGENTTSYWFGPDMARRSRDEDDLYLQIHFNRAEDKMWGYKAPPP